MAAAIGTLTKKLDSRLESLAAVSKFKTFGYFLKLVYSLKNTGMLR